MEWRTFFLNFASSADVEEIAARENSSSQKTIFELQDLVQKIALKEKVDESREFAQTIQKSMATQMQKARASAKDRGVKQAPFIVLIGAQHAFHSFGDFLRQQSFRRKAPQIAKFSPKNC